MIDSKKQLFLILDSMEDFQRSLIEKGGMTNESWELLDGLEKVIAETKHHRNDIEMQAWQIQRIVGNVEGSSECVRKRWTTRAMPGRPEVCRSGR